MTQNKVSLNNFNISNDLPFTLIAGPCALESHDHAKLMVEKLLEITSKAKVNFIYKTSYDKANRTSLNADRGMGLDASLRIFSDLKEEYDISILTDVHTANDCVSIKDYVDVIQIPAFLCRQTDLLIAAAKTMKIINVKKGQFLSPYDMINVANKILDTGNKNLLLTERGVSFGYNTLVSDMRSLEIMKNEIKFPVIFDATHSVQAPGGQGESSGGDRQFVPVLAKAAVAVGIGGVFIETHENPDKAPSDGPNMVKIDDLYKLIMKLIEIDNVVKQS
ncbi:3-deoxy-8-phosphooctulonate synthase [Pelagibacteraceae bacterium]|nr:3-deoxy-8-phosphooctulonate synthase [Pelagibacteraceae bacterium]